MGIALLFLSQIEMTSGRITLALKRSFYLAESGIESGRRTLNDAYDVDDGLDDDLEDAAGPNGSVDLDPAALQPVYDEDGQVTGFSGFGDDVSLTGKVDLAGGTFAAFLTNDPAELLGASPLDDTDRRVMLTSIGTGPRGAVEVVQAIIEPVNLLPPLPLATISLLGPTPTFGSGTSSASAYSGSDCPLTGGGTPGLYVPIVGAVGPAAETSVEAGMDGNPSYTSGPYHDEDTVVDFTDPADPLGPGEIDVAWTTCTALHDMVEALRAQASYVCDGNGGSCDIPPTTMTSISFLGGQSVTVGPGPVGEGLLVATGEVQWLGNATWEGIVMVIGAGVLIRSGGGNGHISGQTIVADIAGPDNVYGTSDDCTGGPAGDGFGIARYEVSGGGNSDIEYCSDLVSQIEPIETFRVVDFLQR
jgi:hypothetical protein